MHISETEWPLWFFISLWNIRTGLHASRYTLIPDRCYPEFTGYRSQEIQVPSKSPSHLLPTHLVPAEWLIHMSASNSQSHRLLPFLALISFLPWPGSSTALRVCFAHHRAETQPISVGCRQLPHGSHGSPGTWTQGNHVVLLIVPRASAFDVVKQSCPQCTILLRRKGNMPRSQPRTAKQTGLAESPGPESSLKTPPKGKS